MPVASDIVGAIIFGMRRAVFASRVSGEQNITPTKSEYTWYIETEEGKTIFEIHKSILIEMND